MFSLPSDDLAHVWQKANCALSQLKNANLFITGGTGFFGQWLLESIHYANTVFNANISVIVLTRNIANFKMKSPQFTDVKWLNFLEGDIRNFKFPLMQITHIIHAATDASAVLNKENPNLMLDTTFLGTRRVLAFAQAAQVKSFLLTSSGAVYGKQPALVPHVDENYTHDNQALDLHSAYGMGKLAAENLSLLYYHQHHLPVKIARCFAFVGPYLPLRTHFAVGNFIANVLDGTDIQIAGDGSPLRSYLYAADLMIWLWTILVVGTPGRIYNVGSDQAISIAQLAQLVAQQAQPVAKVHIAKERQINIPIEQYVPCTKRAQKELQLSAWIDLPTAIQRTINWNKTNAEIKSLCS